jgi:hypothetical protein
MARVAARPTVRAHERRLLGIDPRTVGPALVVLGLAVVMSVVLPSIDSETAYRDQVHKGGIAEIADGITVVPASGWDLASGALVGKTRSPVGSTATTELVDGSVTFFVQAAPFDGPPSALLARINKINADLHHARGRAAGTTDRYEVTTHQGVVGVAEDFVGVARQGSVVAFVFKSPAQSINSHGEGVEIVAAGPAGAISRRRDDIVAMIRSIRTAS